MTMHRAPATYGDALGLIGGTVPGHLAADAEIPVLTGPQAQGDLLVLPSAVPAVARLARVGQDGVPVVRGGGGTTHWLHAGVGGPGASWWFRAAGPVEQEELLARGDDEEALVVGYLEVPEGRTALLIHTDGPGANAIGPGTYVVRRKRQAELSGRASGSGRGRSGQRDVAVRCRATGRNRSAVGLVCQLLCGAK